MFKKNDVNLDKIDTLIGKNTKLEGKLNGKGTIRLDGELQGDMIVEGNVVIGESGVVKGNITCNNLFIAGLVEGNVECSEQLRIANSSKLFGDIKVKTFIVDENAVYEGNCQMIHDKDLEKKDKKAEKSS